MPLIAVAMGHEHYHPIYAALAERGLPLIVHPGGSEGEVLGAANIGGTGPRTPEETFTLLPQVAQANIGSLVFNGVFDLFPELTVVFAGWGFEWAPTMLWRVDSEWRGLRVAVPWLTRAPSEVIADHVRLVVDGVRLGAAAGRMGARCAPARPGAALRLGRAVQPRRRRAVARGGARRRCARGSRDENAAAVFSRA